MCARVSMPTHRHKEVVLPEMERSRLVSAQKLRIPFQVGSVNGNRCADEDHNKNVCLREHEYIHERDKLLSPYPGKL